MAFGDKKPGLSIILGIGKKKDPLDSSAPPSMSKPPSMPPDEPGAEGESSGGDLTPDMLLYHGADTTCESCSHFTAPSTCDRWPDPVEAGGWCRGYESQQQEGDLGDSTGEGMPDMAGAAS